MTLLEAFPKDADGMILLDPAGEVNGQPVSGTVNPEWFVTTFPTLASAHVPLDNESFAALKAIDPYWAQNADRWRAQGLI